MEVVMYNQWIQYVVWGTWFILVVAWNYIYPDVKWWEDVFVTVCLAAFNRALIRNLG
tara:strand:+ start:2124 stop:2294 length:171 start_codon:yes stop_codon:yes gene_type:complete